MKIHWLASPTGKVLIFIIKSLHKVMLSLDVILTTGQGLLIFSVFVLDCQYILNPVFTISRKLKKKILVGRSRLLLNH